MQEQNQIRNKGLSRALHKNHAAHRAVEYARIGNSATTESFSISSTLILPLFSLLGFRSNVSLFFSRAKRQMGRFVLLVCGR